ncbi:MAG: hypothetical protein ACRDSH_02620 [Pseudonocardiaceae bacterium]
MAMLGSDPGCDPSAPSSNEAACDDADSLPPAGQVIDAAVKLGGERYAGVWIDRSKSPSRQNQMVALVDATDADQAALDAIPGADSRVIAVNVKFSGADLSNARDVLERALHAAGVVVSIGVQPNDNRVFVDVAPEDLQSVQKIVAQLALDPQLLEFNDLVLASPTTSRTTFPPFAGGLDLTVSPRSGENATACTSGYTIVNTNDNYMGLTAGHCGTAPDADNVYIGNTFLSIDGRNSYAGRGSANSDSMRFTLQPQSSRSGKIFVSQPNVDYRSVQAPRYMPRELEVGTNVCFQGITSGTN